MTTTSLTTVHINNAKPPPAHQDGPEGGRHEDETRHRVYVTNFPQGTPEFLLEHFFIHWMVHYFICDVPPVVKCIGLITVGILPYYSSIVHTMQQER